MKSYAERLKHLRVKRERARADRKSLAEEIHAFELQCREGEHTDTGRAWELLTRAEAALRSTL